MGEDGQASTGILPEPEGVTNKNKQKPKQLQMMERRKEVKLREKEVKKDLRTKMRKYRKDNVTENQPRYRVEPDQPQRLRTTLRNAKRMKEDALKSAARAELIHHTSEVGFLEFEEGEEGRDLRQKDIVKSVDLQTSRKRFDLVLDRLGPYVHTYSPNGNMVALAGEKGHLAIFKWKEFKPFGEAQLKDKVYDVKFLHDDQLLATAQKKYVYIYNNKGAEVHLLKNLQNCRVLDFLPHHFLLTAVGSQGVLHYFDTSIGEHVSVQKTKMGPCNVMRQNPWNAVMALGHTSGVVSMWSPTCSAPLVKVLAHKAPLIDLCFPLDGRHMVTAAADAQVKVWDTRMWKTLHTVHQSSAPSHLDISQTGLLAIASYHRLEVWKDWTGTRPKTPYLAYQNKNNADTIAKLRFCPYEDILGVSHASGFASVIVPGSGEANYDYYVANPYETQQQRKERPVHMLLDKLPPSLITLNPRSIGAVDSKKKAKGLEKKKRQALVERQQQHVKEMAEKGVDEADIASDDVEETIIRPEQDPASKDKTRTKIKRPKHLKEKKIYLQKQEHAMWKARQAAKRRRAEERGDTQGQSGENEEVDFVESSPADPLPDNETSEGAEKPKKKRRRKSVTLPSDPLDAFFKKDAVMKKASGQRVRPEK